MNKCLSLVHLTSTVESQPSGSDESTSWFLRSPNLDLDSADTKSLSVRLTPMAAPCSGLRLNVRLADHSGTTSFLFRREKGVYEDECGLNKCIGLKSSNHSQMLHRLALRKLFACVDGPDMPYVSPVSASSQ